MTTLEHGMQTPTACAQVRHGAVTGRPRLFLRAEGAVLLACALLGFATTGQSWWLVPLMLLVPDLFMAGYARSSRLGALTYNLAHTYPLPAVVGVLSLTQDHALGQAVSLVWFAHIGMDRALGYGLKHDDGFRHTHLGALGRR
jgi:hypothetical protein